MKIKNLFTCLGEASRKAWACLAVALPRRACLAVALRRRACLAAVALRRRVLPALIAVLNLLSVGQAPAQTFTSLGNHGGSFDSPIYLGNTLYASVHGLVLSGNTFFGTSFGDYETHDSGWVYAVNFDGTGYSSTSLHVFTPLPTYAPFINADGAFPYAGLILSGRTLYGTTQRGGYGDGTYGDGTLFAVSTNGTGFTNLHNFRSGSYPGDAVYLAGNIPYGTTR